MNASQVLTQTPDGIVIRLFVQPKARRTGIIGLHGDRLKVSVTEPPDRGKATEAVVRLIAETFHTTRSTVQVLRGDISRQKDLLLQAQSMSAVREILDGLLHHDQRSDDAASDGK